MLEQTGKSEFKWEKISRRHGVQLVDFFFRRSERIRVDVLIWDIEDKRHKDVPFRDDKANFARMYYHLLHNVLKLRWPDGARWIVCPDEQKEVDWLTLESCLAWKGWAREESLFTSSTNLPELRDYYNIQEIRPFASDKAPLIQLADLFAGLGAYSHKCFEKYEFWKIRQDLTPELFGFPECGVPEPKLSHNDRERLPIVHRVKEEAARRKFQVSVDSCRGLSSHDPDKPLNFWVYSPQHPLDKAPTKCPRESPR